MLPPSPQPILCNMNQYAIGDSLAVADHLGLLPTGVESATRRFVRGSAAIRSF